MEDQDNTLWRESDNSVIRGDFRLSVQTTAPLDPQPNDLWVDTT